MKLSYTQQEVLHHMAKTGAILIIRYGSQIAYQGEWKYPPSISTIEALKKKGLLSGFYGRWEITELGKLSVT